MDREAEALLDAQIMADITGSAPPGSPGSDDPLEIRVEPVAVTPQEAAPAAPVAQPEPVADPLETYEFKHRGQEVKIDLTPEQKREYVQKGYDYTTKTMELAQFRREAQDFVNQVRSEQKAQAEAVINLLNDPEKLSAILNAKRQAMGLEPQAPLAPPAQEDDLEFVSKSQLKELMQEMEKKVEVRVRAESEKAKGAVREDIEFRQLESGYKNDFDRHIDTLLREKFPVLSEFGGEEVADKIRADAHRFTQSFMILNPGLAIDPNQVKGVMVESAKKRSEAIEGKLREREKKVALSGARLVERGAEPKGGGAAPAPPAAKALKLKDPALDAQVLQEIESIMGRGR